jgi:coenzyme F420 biosynthesis associated uncharacterized protein
VADPLHRGLTDRGPADRDPADDAPAIADWALAEKVAWQVATANMPKATAQDVARLRSDIDLTAMVADRYARRATGLGDGLPPAEVRVVGRREWIRSNLESLEWLTLPLREKLADRPGGRVVSRSVIGAQIGTVFGFLATRVLGQYEVFLPQGATPGRLTLVGPNLLQVERTVLPEVGVSAREFRLGVVLHELAHRLQFEAVDWMRPQLQQILDEYIADTRLGPERVKEALEQVIELVRRPERATDLRQLLQIVLTPTQRDLLDRAQSMMSLLEGHGNVTMEWGAELAADDEGIVLDASRVRRALNARRDRRGGVGATIMKRAMGMAMKAEQYRVGERFILSVAQRHGREVFSRVWESPAHLPSTDELEDPDAWAQRIRSST